jgi:hypothetical protein
VHKSALTYFLDFVRHLLIISGTGAVLCLLWSRVPWQLAIISAIPAWAVMFCLADFLTLPLYFLTPEHRVVSTALKAIKEDDFSTALRVLEAYEKINAAQSQGTPHATTGEGSDGQNEFLSTRDGRLLNNGCDLRSGNGADHAKLVGSAKPI